MAVIDLKAADETIRRYLLRTDSLITGSDVAGREAARDLLELLLSADRNLKTSLEQWVSEHGGADMAFSQASYVSYRAQIATVVEFVQGQLRGLTGAQAVRAARLSLSRTERLLNQLEKSFTGVARPVRLEEAIVSLQSPSLLARHATSVSRYGHSMIRRMEVELSRGFVEGISQGQMVDRITRLGDRDVRLPLRRVPIQPGMSVQIGRRTIRPGPFMLNRSWAWRIVRTEMAEAQNAVSLDSIERARREFPDMQKKILAVLDNRTAQDSLGVHGQVRPVNGMFRDGAGREYQRPPSRPHDRETVIPWRQGWPETRSSRPLSRRRQEEIWERNRKWQGERQRRRRVAKASGSR